MADEKENSALTLLRKQLAERRAVKATTSNKIPINPAIKYYKSHSPNFSCQYADRYDMNGKQIKFRDGFYNTADKAIQSFLEINFVRRDYIIELKEKAVEKIVEEKSTDDSIEKDSIEKEEASTIKTGMSSSVDSV
jgi:hypothetical protein